MTDEELKDLNLDNYVSPDELTEVEQRLFATRLEPELCEIAMQLWAYAVLKQAAMRARLGRVIPVAKYFELQCELIYSELPDAYLW